MGKKLLSFFIVLLSLIDISMAQSRRVTGRVTSVEGKSLSGVSVFQKQSAKGVSTDASGVYSIEVPQGTTLVFQYVGFQRKEVVVGSSAEINVQLESDDKTIDEVVITGMGLRVDKRLFTGATSKISGEAAAIGGLPDPSRGLEGRVAGVSVQNVSGTFGTAPRIKVRGATSLYGSSKPLWVVDGVILEDVADVSSDALSSGDALTLISSAVAGLNANDIESFQILKDGSATSIYGARAMAGVIVITTKRGVAGRNAITYSGEYTSRAIPRYTEFNIMNSQEQMSVYKEMYQKGYLLLAETSNASSSGVYGKMYQLINEGKLFNDLYLGGAETNKYLRQAEYRNTDWFDELFSTGLQHNHSVSLSSGTEKAQYYASLSGLVDPGWTKASSVDRYTYNLNANYNIFNNFKLNIITNGSYRNQKAPGTLGQSTDVVFGEVKRDFDINPYMYAMNTSRTMDAREYYVRNYAPFNILNELENNYIDNKVTDLKFQGELTWKPLTNLMFTALGSLRYQGTAQHHHIKDRSNQAIAYRWMPTTAIRDLNPYLYKDPNDPYALPISVLTEGGIYNRSDYDLLTKDFRFTVQYDKKFDDKNSLTLFGATTINDAKRTNTWFRGWGMQYDLGEIPYVVYQTFKRGQEENSPYYRLVNTRSREAAFLVNANYSYDNKYILNGSARYEGSNRLGMTTSSRWMPSWNISGAWNIHQENFFEDLTPALSHLMVKASYSLTGDRGPSNVTNSRAVISAYNPWRPNVIDSESGLQVRDPENRGLTYEKKKEINLGLSAGLLDNRINLEFDWFKRNNFDLIGFINTQGASGTIYKMGNVANMKSQGAELSVTGHIFRDTKFKWTTNFIYTHVTNKVTDLKTQSRVIDLITGNGFALEGYSARSLFSIPFAGLNNEGLPTFNNKNGETTVSGIYFQETDDLSFLKYSGTTEPTDMGSLGNTFTYGGFRLNVFMTYSFGNVIRLNPIFRNSYTDFMAMPREFKNRWVIPGDEDRTTIPTIATTRQNRNDTDLKIAYSSYNYSTDRIAKGDFIRLKDVSLAYEFPKEKIAAWKLSSLGLRFNATNLFLIYADKKLNGQDPEFINSGGVAAPIPRQYTLTLRLGL